MQRDISINMLDHMGSLVDQLFLTIPRILNPIKPARKIDIDGYLREMDFYFEMDMVNHPEKLFQFTDTTPKHEKVGDIPFMEGRRETYRFHSEFTPINPLVRPRYHAHTANHHAWFIRWTHGDTPRKTVICLHGYMLGEPNQAERMFSVRKLFKKGLDVVLFVAPFHWKRAPMGKLHRGIFLQPDDVVMTCEAISHTMTDLNATISILKDMGVPEPGLIGASMGGYHAALFSCLSTRVSFAVMVVPAVDYSAPFGPSSVRYGFSVSPGMMEKMNTIWTFHSPIHLQPKIDKDHLLFIASKGDKLCPSPNLVRLLEQWHWPRHAFLTGGHWLIFNNRKRGKLWYQFLEHMNFIS